MSVKKKSKSRGLKKIDTSKKEEELRDLLTDIVDERGIISKYILEGHLLYTLNCNNVEMYNVIMSLKNNRELYSLELDDGEYYKYYPKL